MNGLPGAATGTASVLLGSTWYDWHPSPVVGTVTTVASGPPSCPTAANPTYDQGVTFILEFHQ